MLNVLWMILLSRGNLLLPVSLEAWDSVLDAHVACDWTVYGDLESGARDLVTALLEDPLSDDQEARNVLVGRHDKHGRYARPIRIRSVVATNELQVCSHAVIVRMRALVQI